MIFCNPTTVILLLSACTLILLTSAQVVPALSIASSVVSPLPGPQTVPVTGPIPVTEPIPMTGPLPVTVSMPVASVPVASVAVASAPASPVLPMVDLNTANKKSNLGVHVPMFFDMTGSHNSDKSLLDLSVLRGLVTVKRDKERDHNGEMNGPMSVSVFGIPVYSSMGDRRSSGGGGGGSWF